LPHSDVASAEHSESRRPCKTVSCTNL